MSKINLGQLSSLANQNTAIVNINSNTTIIQTAFDNTLSRDGTSPNQMLADFDMNNFQILNLPTPLLPNDPVRLQDLTAAAIAGLPIYTGGTSLVSYFPGISTNVLGIGIPGMYNPPTGWVIHSAPTSAASGNPVDVLRVDRYSNYVGGTQGFVRSAIHAYSYVLNTGDIDDEFAITAELHNGALGGALADAQNGAIIASGIKAIVGASATWGANIFALDATGEANPSYPLTGIEVDVFTNGTDTNKIRLGLGIFVGKAVGGSGVFAHVGTALLIGVENNDITQGQFDTQIKMTGLGVTGIDMSGMVFTGKAIQLYDSQRVSFEINGLHDLTYTGGALTWLVNNVGQFFVTDTGALSILGALTVNSTIMIATNTSFLNGAAGGTGTLTNAPLSGNPTKWIEINDNGTARYIPAW